MKNQRRLRIAFACCALAALMSFCSVPVFSQSATGRIVGLVTDPSGAVVSGAKVTVTNSATGIASHADSGSDGRYQALNLPVGAYTVSVQHPGFETALTPSNDLEINQTVRVDVQLALGSVGQVIAVEAQAPQVETENPTIGGTIVGAAVQELPLNGRDPMSLLQTQPGVSGSFTTGSNGGSIAGGRTDNVSFLLDGSSNNIVRSSSLNFDPNPDAVAEFRVLLNNYTAEYGRSGGGVVSVVTKSGTNRLHGSFFEYVRNTDFNANNFFLNSAGQARAILQRNQFGATAGGPVVLPKIVNGHDKLFFFSSYQGQRQNQTSVGSLDSVFTPAEAQGDFSHAVNGKPDPSVVAFLQQYPFFQPVPSLASQGIVASGAINPVFQNFAKASLIFTSPTGTLVPTYATQLNFDQYTGKVDYLVTPNDRVSGTLGYQKNPQVNPGGTNPGFPIATTNTSSFLNLDYTKTIRPTLINDFRASVTRYRQVENNPTTTTPGPNSLGININPDLVLGSPQISMPGGYLSLGYNPNNAVLTDTTYNYSDTFTWNRGSHTFKGGFSLMVSQENSDYNYDTMGEFDFSGASTSIGSGNPLADFLMGLPDTFQQYPSAFSNMRSKVYGAFFQDEWKVSKRLLVTIGVRYEYGTPQTDTLGRSFAIIPGEQSKRFTAAPVGAVFPGDPGAPKGLYFGDYRDGFAPRLGFAWDPFGNGKTSVRGGFGVFHNILNGWVQDENNGVPPYYAGVSISSNGGSPLGAISALPQYMSNPYVANGQPNPFPSHAILSSNDPNLFINLADIPFGTGNWFSNIHLKTPYIYNYSLAVQRQLAHDLAIDVSYAGSNSNGLTNMEDGNPIILGTNVRVLNVGRYPYFNDPDRGLTDNGFAALPDYITNDGRANYGGLLASVTKRLGAIHYVGSTFFTLAYTWSHNLDNGSGSITSSAGDIPSYNHEALKGNSNLDQRQRLTLSGGWELPFAQAWTSAPKRLTRGWTLYPILSAYTGAPFSISAGLRENTVGNKPGPSGAGDLNIVSVQQLTASVQTYDPHTTTSIPSGSKTLTGLYYFNPNDFTVPSTWNSASFLPSASTYTYGMARNSVPGIGLVNFDIALAKKTMLFRERVSSEFRLEAFNVFNHTEFANPNTSRTSALFGQVTSVASNRVLQLALRIVY